MSKFATATMVPNTTAPVRTVSAEPDAVTHEGGAGYSRDPKSELFLLAVTNMVSEGTFYEAGKDRDARFVRLVRQVTAEDPDWIRRFVPFLRDRMNMRSASVVMAAEYVKAGGPKGRRVIGSALSRADEPAEMLAYWHKTHGRKVPQPVKRGIADAIGRLYTERALLKYDGQAKGYRFGDLIDLVHPTPIAPWQSALFRLALDRRHKRERIEYDAELLPIVAGRDALDAIEDKRSVLDDPARLKAAGVTWEWLSAYLSGPMDAKAWEAVIPSMGYMALLRNLRNFDDAGVSDGSKATVIAKLTDPAEVRSSRQLPLRFYSAFKNTATLGWAQAIESALEVSLENVPSLSGRTLILVDVSGSMAGAMSDRSKANRWELAALFGSALAARAESADLVAFQSDSTVIPVRRGASVLRSVEEIGHRVGGGTETMAAVREHFKAHDRIVILTDEQAFRDDHGLGVVVGLDVPVYTFNLAGYAAGHLPSGSDRRYTFGGLTDLGFAAIDLLERHRSTEWPF